MEALLNAGMAEDVSFLPIRSSGNYREIVIPLNEPNLQNANSSQFQESFLQLLHQIVENAQNAGGSRAQAGAAREDELPPRPSGHPLTGQTNAAAAETTAKPAAKPSLMWGRRKGLKVGVGCAISE